MMVKRLTKLRSIMGGAALCAVLASCVAPPPATGSDARADVGRTVAPMTCEDLGNASISVGFRSLARATLSYGSWPKQYGILSNRWLSPIL